MSELVDTAKIRKQHERREVPFDRYECCICNQAWPCDAIRLCDALDEARAELADAENRLHPWYGPCDGFGKDGVCAECEEVGSWKWPEDRPRIEAIQRYVAQLEADNAALRERLEESKVRAHAEAQGNEGHFREVQQLEQQLADERAKLEAAEREKVEWISLVFDGPPGPDSCRFIEAEVEGRGIRVGEWYERTDGLWELQMRAVISTALARDGGNDEG